MYTFRTWKFCTKRFYIEKIQYRQKSTTEFCTVSVFDEPKLFISNDCDAIWSCTRSEDIGPRPLQKVLSDMMMPSFAIWLGALVSLSSAADSPTSATSLSAAGLPGAVVLGDGNYLFWGCYTDQGSTRLVTGTLAPPPATFNSVQECLYYCTAGILIIPLLTNIYVAVENGGTCYCGNKLNLVPGNAALGGKMISE